jgi:hypothetical protein
MTGLSLQMMKVKEKLTEYARQRYETASVQAQRGLIDFAENLKDDDLHVRIPDVVKRSS